MGRSHSGLGTGASSDLQAAKAPRLAVQRDGETAALRRNSKWPIDLQISVVKPIFRLHLIYRREDALG